MTCSEFLAGYSDFQDGDLRPEVGSAYAEHLEKCAPCRRYHDVVVKGVATLRAFPAPVLRDDFEDRLRHSIYSLEEAGRRRRLHSPRPEGTTAMAAVALGVVTLAVLMTPFLFRSTPSVALPAIVVGPPTPNPASSFGAPLTFPALGVDPWGPPPVLLYPHSPLGKRDRGPALVRTGTQ